MYTVEQNNANIDAVLNKCAEQEDDGGSQYPGMSYEQGVKAGIEWLTNSGSESPLG